MRELFFLEPAVHPGLNLTVRDGAKWADVQPGEPITIYKTGAAKTGYEPMALAIGAGKFDELVKIPDPLLAFEHDQTCRNFEGLVAAMDRSYPDGHGADGYTVLLFWMP